MRSLSPQERNGSCGSGSGRDRQTRGKPFGAAFEQTFRDRIEEADEFYAERIPAGATDDEHRVLRQAYAGLLWSKQFYHYVDPGLARRRSRAADAARRPDVRPQRAIGRTCTTAT